MKHGRIAGLFAVLVAGSGIWIGWKQDRPTPAIPAAPPATKTEEVRVENNRSPILTKVVEFSPVPETKESGEEWDRLSPAELLTILQQKLDAGAPLEEVLSILDHMMKARSAVGLNLAESLKVTEEQRRAILARVVGTWAKTDAPAAWQWVLQHARRLDLSENVSLIRNVFREMAVSNPGLVVSHTETLLAGAKQPGNSIDFEPVDLAHAAVEALLRNGHEESARRVLERWAGHSTISENAGAALESFALHLAEKSPAEAANWLKTLPVTSSRNSAMGSLATEWTKKGNPGEVLDWAGSLPEESGRTAMVESAFREWVTQDPVSAGHWLNDQVAKSGRNSGTDTLITTLITDSTFSVQQPEVAMEWAERISDQALRTESIEQIKVQREEQRHVPRK